MEKELIEKIESGLSIVELATYFKVSVGSIRYKIKKFGLKTNGYKKEHNWDKNKLLNAINKSKCKSDILRHLGIKIKSGNFQTLDRYCLKYNIDISGLKYDNSRGNRFTRMLDNKDVFIKNSNIAGKNIKRRILQDKLIEYKCFKCENEGEWMGEKISLQLDHINGVNNDNRLENLRFACPNCHSQTPTFGGRNKK